MAKETKYEEHGTRLMPETASRSHSDEFHYGSVREHCGVAGRMWGLAQVA